MRALNPKLVVAAPNLRVRREGPHAVPHGPQLPGWATGTWKNTLLEDTGRRAGCAVARVVFRKFGFQRL